jgi:hypothetical protein
MAVSKTTQNKPVKAAATPAPAEPAEQAAPVCKVPECTKDPELRGLCGGHWSTRRDLANPRRPRDGE